MRKQLDEEMKQLKLEAKREILEEAFRQVEIEEINNKDKTIIRENKFMKRTNKLGKVAAVILGVLVVGTTTVLAATGIMKLNAKSEGTFGVKVGITESEGTYVIPEEINEISIEFGVIPAGMVNYQDDKLLAADENPDNYITPQIIVLDEAYNKDVIETFVESMEEVTIGNRDAVKILHMDGRKTYYVMYPEEYRIAVFMVGDEVTEDAVTKAIEGFKLNPTGKTMPIDEFYLWSAYIKDMYAINEAIKSPNVNEEEILYPLTDLTALHKINEDISLDSVFENENTVTAKVTNVQILDNLSLLENESQIPDSWKEAIRADGKFVENEIQFIKNGDGINSTNEVISSQKVNQKLVYVTVEYTNNGTKELESFGYFISMNYLDEMSDGYKLYYLFPRDISSVGADCVNYTSAADDWWEMRYNSVEDEFGKNHIESIAPGETVTVNVAYMVNEDVLPYMCLALNGGYSAESNVNKEECFVDIRIK